MSFQCCSSYAQCEIMKNFTLTGKKIREISCLVISLVKPLLTRIFCQISVRVNFRNFHNAMPWFRSINNYCHSTNKSSNQFTHLSTQSKNSRIEILWYEIILERNLILFWPFFVKISWNQRFITKLHDKMFSRNFFKPE